MSSKLLYRLSGGALLAGGLLMALGLLGALFIIGRDPPDNASVADASSLFLLSFLAIACGLILIVVGLPGMYMRQAERTGVVGLIGFVLTMLGVLLNLGMVLIVTVFVPWLVTVAPELLHTGPPTLFLLMYGAFLLLGIGSLVLGLVMVQANSLLRGASVLLIISGLANLIAIPVWPVSVAGFIGQFLFAGGLAWVGYALVSQRLEETMVSPSVVTEAQS